MTKKLAHLAVSKTTGIISQPSDFNVRACIYNAKAL